MNKHLSVLKLIAESLQQQIPVMLLYVLESSGSSPGRQGFFMVVNTKGEMAGSIGGGIMEHKFVEMAKEKLRVRSCELRETYIRKQVHDKTVAKDQSGMICSGEQTILLYPVQERDAEQIQKLISSLEQKINGTLILSPEGIQFLNVIPEKDFDFSCNQKITGYIKKRLVIKTNFLLSVAAIVPWLFQIDERDGFLIFIFMTIEKTCQQ
jgi:xanthine dehydrogenase accessory factor